MNEGSSTCALDRLQLIDGGFVSTLSKSARQMDLRPMFMVLIAILVLSLFAQCNAQLSESTETQKELTKFLSITCDQANNLYTYRINNGLIFPADFTVTLVCDRATGSSSVVSLSGFTASDELVIRPTFGSIANQKCTLSLVAKDFYGDINNNIEYDKRTRLCGRRGIFDSDDSNDCTWFDCIGTNQWWHTGILYVIGYAAVAVISVLLALAIAARHNKSISDRFMQGNVAGVNPVGVQSLVVENFNKKLKINSDTEKVVVNQLKEQYSSAFAKAAVASAKGGASFHSVFESNSNSSSSHSSHSLTPEDSIYEHHFHALLSDDTFGNKSFYHGMLNTAKKGGASHKESSLSERYSSFKTVDSANLEDHTYDPTDRVVIPFPADGEDSLSTSPFASHGLSRRGGFATAQLGEDEVFDL